MTPQIAATIIPSFAIVFIGTTVYFHNRKSTTNLLFFLICLSTLLWSVTNYFSVVATPEESIVWIRLVLFFAAPHSIILLLFVLNFPHKRFRINKYLASSILLALVGAMAIAISPYVFTDVNVDKNIVTPVPGILMPVYGLIILGAITASIVTMIIKYVRTAPVQRKKWAFMLLGTAVSYILLIVTNYLFVVVLKDTSFNVYGPVFMLPTFLGITYAILRHNALNIKAITAEILTFSILSVSLVDIFLTKDSSQVFLKILIFILFFIFGLFLIRSVIKEVKQREQIEKLAKELKKANDKLKVLDKMKSEFVSIASHQLRSPLTSIRGYSSMLLEGSYGKLTTKAAEAVQRIADSSRFMALSVEDYLNVSRIEAGNMKYEIADFNLKDTAEKVVDEMRPAALKRGLLLIFRSDCDGSCSVHADIGKVRQVIMNIVDNAMKYTEKGSITVIAHDDPKKKKMYISVKDTGVGMEKETIEEMFHKFTRAKNANEINVTGTGLGLFVAKRMIEEMGGRIWAESEGEGKGSTFHIELKLLPGKPVKLPKRTKLER